MPEPSVFVFELAIEELKRYNSPGVDQIPAELVKAGSRTNRAVTHTLFISILNKNELPEECKNSIIVRIYKKV